MNEDVEVIDNVDDGRGRGRSHRSRDHGPDRGSDDRGPRGVLPVLTSVVQRRWTSSIFGIVAPGPVRRRPSDIGRVLLAVVVVALTAAGTSTGSHLEEAVFGVFTALPEGVNGLFEALYLAAPVVAAVVVVSAVVARRPRLLLTLVIAGGLTWLLGTALARLVDVPEALEDAGARLHGHTPDFPVVRLATAAAILLASRTYLTRPARRLLEAAIWLSALGAAYLAEGLPGGIVGSLALAWGTAALALLVLGSPGGTPAPEQVARSLAELGVTAGGLRLDPEQSWGRVHYLAEDHSDRIGDPLDRSGDGSPSVEDEPGPDSELAIDVVGRDSTDARLFAKLWRFVWYKDSGPTLSLRRDQQVVHEAFVLLLAARTGARVPELVAVGVAGARDDALLVARNPPGPRLADLPVERVTDAVLDDAWANLGLLHGADVTHSDAGTHNVVVGRDGTTGLVGLAGGGLTSASDQRKRFDQVQLLVTTAALVGSERALDAAERAVGRDRTTELFPLLQAAALTARARDTIVDLKATLGDLREIAASRTGVDVPKPTELRRFSLGGIFLAAAFALGVYLLVGQLAGVAAMGDIFEGASWEWILAAFVLAQLPQFSQAVAMLGSVAARLPFGPVTAVQFANAFTGLIGGTAGTATLNIRFFQKQGLAPAVAVSSGVLNSLTGFVVQAGLVLIGLAVTGDEFQAADDGGGLPGWVLPLVAVVGLALLVALLIPRVRRRVRTMVAAQLRLAWENIRGILSTPRKAIQLLVGNLTSQLLFAMAIGAALHAYGDSLPILQLVVINSFASFIGGVAPVPGGMGVVESGLILGLTSAGIDQSDAVAATFTARLFTAYLPPIWGWFSFQWLRRHEYV